MPTPRMSLGAVRFSLHESDDEILVVVTDSITEVHLYSTLDPRLVAGDVARLVANLEKIVALLRG